MQDNVSICTPFYSEIHPRTMEMVRALCAASNDERKFTFLVEQGSLLWMNRNNLVRRALAVGSTHILWVDSDMATDTPLAIVDKMLSEMDGVYGVVTASYEIRGGEASQLCAFHTKDGVEMSIPVATKGTMEIDWCGLGFCLVSMDIYRGMKPEWYYGSVKVATDGMHLPTSEDHTWCDRVTGELHHPILLMADMRIEHLPRPPYGNQAPAAVVPAVTQRETVMVELLKQAAMLHQNTLQVMDSFAQSAAGKQ